MIVENTSLTIKSKWIEAEDLKNLLKEIEEIKKDHPGIIINIEVTRE